MRLVLGCLLLLSSCVGVETYTAADGRQAISLDCDYLGTTACYTQARESCGDKDYEVLRHYQDGKKEQLEIVCTT